MLEARRADNASVDRACARIFASEDGQILLGYLQAMIFLRGPSLDASDAQIRQSEGQRALLAQLMRMAQAGRAQP